MLCSNSRQELLGCRWLSAAEPKPPKSRNINLSLYLGCRATVHLLSTYSILSVGFPKLISHSQKGASTSCRSLGIAAFTRSRKKVTSSSYYTSTEKSKHVSEQMQDISTAYSLTKGPPRKYFPKYQSHMVLLLPLEHTLKVTQPPQILLLHLAVFCGSSDTGPFKAFSLFISPCPSPRKAC